MVVIVPDGVTWRMRLFCWSAMREVAVRVDHDVGGIEKPGGESGAAIAHGARRFAASVGGRLLAAARNGVIAAGSVDPPDPLVFGIRDIEVARGIERNVAGLLEAVGSQEFCRLASASVADTAGPPSPSLPRMPERPATVVRVWASSVAIRNSNPRQARTLPF